MPFATHDGCRIYWRIDGAADRPTLLLLNSIGTDMALWDRAAPNLVPAFRLVRMDTRGHGASDAPDRDYSLAELAGDVLAVMDAAGVDKTAVAGVSLGGMIAMELALTAPERVTALALICTSAEMDRNAWTERVARVRAEGMTAIADLVMGRFLSPTFARAHPQIEQTLRRGLNSMSAAGYAGAGAAIRDMELMPRISTVAVPTLVVTGKRDISTPCVDHGGRIADAIAGAKLAQLDCAHLPPTEAPAELASVLVRFLLRDETVADAAHALFDAGLKNRRRILGDEWVDRALENRTPFNSDFQEMVTRTAWHEVWGRPGLDDRTRRLVVVAITAALGRWEEFCLHVRTGLERDGFTRDELKEVLMQTGIYAGLPAANTAFREAAEIVAALILDEP